MASCPTPEEASVTHRLGLGSDHSIVAGAYRSDPRCWRTARLLFFRAKGVNSEVREWIRACSRTSSSSSSTINLTLVFDAAAREPSQRVCAVVYNGTKLGTYCTMKSREANGGARAPPPFFQSSSFKDP
jgi:hypothetical protein